MNEKNNNKNIYQHELKTERILIMIYLKGFSHAEYDIWAEFEIGCCMMAAAWKFNFKLDLNNA